VISSKKQLPDHILQSKTKELLLKNVCRLTVDIFPNFWGTYFEILGESYICLYWIISVTLKLLSPLGLWNFICLHT
jgi:hypothetical protein